MSLSPAILDREMDKFTLDTSGNTAVRIVGDLTISSGASGTPFNSSFVGITVPGTETTGITFTVGSGVSRRLIQLIASCSKTVRIRVFKGSTLLASGRLGAGTYNLNLELSPNETILTGEIVTVTFEAPASEPVTDLEIFLKGTEG